MLQNEGWKARSSNVVRPKIYHLSRDFGAFIHRGINGGIILLRMAGVFYLPTAASSWGSLITVFFTTITSMVAVAVYLSTPHHLLPC